MMLGIVKKLLCNHDWEKMRFDSFWWDGDWNHNGTDYYVCRCIKCGTRKVLPFEVDVQSFADYPGREEEMMNQRDRSVDYPCIRCGNPVRVTEAYDRKTSQYVLIEPPICDVCSEENRSVIDNVNKK